MDHGNQCDNCGEDIEVIDGDLDEDAIETDDGLFCSASCHDAFTSENDMTGERSCQTCGNIVIAASENREVLCPKGFDQDENHNGPFCDEICHEKFLKTHGKDVKDNEI